MAVQKSKLSPKEIKRLNDDLKDLELIKEDVQRAMNAGVPGTDKLIDGCNECQEAITKLKAVYAERQ